MVFQVHEDRESASLFLYVILISYGRVKLPEFDTGRGVAKVGQVVQPPRAVEHKGPKKLTLNEYFK